MIVEIQLGTIEQVGSARSGTVHRQTQRARSDLRHRADKAGLAGAPARNERK